MQKTPPAIVLRDLIHTLHLHILTGPVKWVPGLWDSVSNYSVASSRVDGPVPSFQALPLYLAAAHTKIPFRRGRAQQELHRKMKQSNSLNRQLWQSGRLKGWQELQQYWHVFSGSDHGDSRWVVCFPSPPPRRVSFFWICQALPA